MNELILKISSCQNDNDKPKFSSYKYGSSTYKSGFGDYELSNITDKNKKDLCTLLSNNVWVFDYVPYKKITNNYGNKQYTRTNFSAFINKKIVDNIAKELSRNNVIVCIHDHMSNLSYVYKNGKQFNFKECDLVTKFELCFNNHGNPYINQLEHVWDYGSDIESLKPVLKQELFEYINNNYVEISVVEQSFSFCSTLKIFKKIVQTIDYTT